jgi:CRISPR-associated protein Csb1
MTGEAKLLTLEDLKQAVAGHAAAFRCVTEYQPAGGPGDKVFPPTYEGGKYAVETRYIDGAPVPCVLLDSVQAQANRMELALLDAVRAERISLPLVEAKFEDEKLLKTFTVTSLEAPHRIADAIFRDSLIVENGKQIMFRKSEKGKILDSADIRNATGLFGLCPTALVFGIWDSTGPRGGLGAKFQRAIVSEMVGIQSCRGITTGGKIDSLGILKAAGTLYRRKNDAIDKPNWTLNPEEALEIKNKKVLIGKEGKPSEVNLGGVTPDFAYAKQNSRMLYEDDGKPRIKGGVTILKAIQSTVISLSTIRRLRFPLTSGIDSGNEADKSARTLLAALALLAATLTREESADLRSRCHLFAQQPTQWELLSTPGHSPTQYLLPVTAAEKLFNDSVEEAKAFGLPWRTNVIQLTPSNELLELVRISQIIGASSEVEEG